MFCVNCGNEMKDTEKFCPNCGQRVGETKPEETKGNEKLSFGDKLKIQLTNKKDGELCCPKCYSTDIRVDMIQTKGKTKKKGNGLLGHTNNALRGITAIGTLGMSNLLWKKSEGNEKTKYTNESVCVCQKCGHHWMA